MNFFQLPAYVAILFCSLRGKQVHQIPLEFLGDEEHVLALCDAGQLTTKVWRNFMLMDGV